MKQLISIQMNFIMQLSELNQILQLLSYYYYVFIVFIKSISTLFFQYLKQTCFIQ